MIKASWAPAVLGTGSGSGSGVVELEPAELAGTAQHRAAALHAPGIELHDVEAGQQLGREDAQLGGQVVDPGPPGPPGLMTRDPMRCAGSVAGCMARAIWIVPSLGLGVVEGRRHRCRTAGAPHGVHCTGVTGRGGIVVVVDVVVVDVVVVGPRGRSRGTRPASPRCRARRTRRPGRTRRAARRATTTSATRRRGLRLTPPPTRRTSSL